ncbi:MAG: terpene cyclase/mutase family protein [Chloroflexota bacterium]|nr:terpene cyclase/mutase family protein [Chloroflexota bacterium]
MNARFNRVTLLVPLLCSLLALAVFGPVAAQDGSGTATPTTAGTGIKGAIAWLLPQQAEDGGFAGFSGESDPGTTLDAIMALSAAETTGVDTGDSVERAIAYLESGDVVLVYAQTGVGQAAKLVLGLSAAGVQPTGFASLEPVALIENGADPATGLYGAGVFDHALSVLALVATGNDVPAAAIDAFTATQAENGGWAFDASTDPTMADSNTTSMSIQALVAAGRGDSESVANGLAYLDSIWLDGGAAYSTLPDTLPDANSTALVIQALIATEGDPSTHVETLAAFQNESGAFHFNAADTSDNLYATNGAIPALALLSFPVDAVEPGATPVAFHVSPAARIS